MLRMVFMFTEDSIFWWTVGESDSRLPDANRLHYHYANGPQIFLLISA